METWSSYWTSKRIGEREEWFRKEKRKVLKIIFASFFFFYFNLIIYFSFNYKKEALKQRLREAETKGEDLSKLKIENEELIKQDEEFKRKEDELKKKERVSELIAYSVRI